MLGAPALLSDGTLLPVDINTGAVSIGQTTISQLHVLGAAIIVTGSPQCGRPALDQVELPITKRTTIVESDNRTLVIETSGRIVVVY